MNISQIIKRLDQQLIRLGKERDKLDAVISELESRLDAVDCAQINIRDALEYLTDARDNLSKEI